MPAGHGTRARTRDSFSRPFRGKGYIPLSVYLRTYHIGDYVDIKVNSAVQKVRMSGAVCLHRLMHIACAVISRVGGRDAHKTTLK